MMYQRVRKKENESGSESIIALEYSGKIDPSPLCGPPAMPDCPMSRLSNQSGEIL